MSRSPHFEPTAVGRPTAGGFSDKEEIWHSGKARLYRYRSIAKPASATPLLIVYALVNRPYMMDLQEDRSLIRGLLARGIDVYLLDWGYPDGTDRFMGLSDYIDGVLHGSVEEILRVQGLDRLNVLGVCQGGVLSLCYGALHPERVRNLITMVTPVDFHTPADLLSKWARKIDIAGWVGDGNVSGDTLNQLFLSLMPFRLTQQKYVELLRGPPDAARMENFMRMEQWIFDSPDQAGAAFREYVTWFYQENRLVRDSLEIAGKPVRLGELQMPLLNLVGMRDHLVPPAASLALEHLAGGADVTTRQFDLGHIGMYVSARAQREVPAAVAGWLESR